MRSPDAADRDGGMRALGIGSRLVGLAETMATAGVVAIALFALVGPALGFQTIVLSGGSMSPAAGVGAVVVTRAVDPASIAVGDVITYRLPTGTVVTHRVTRLEDAYPAPSFEVKGDGNATPDPTPVPGSWVIGREVVAIPLLGYPILVVSNPWGLATVLALASAILLARGRGSHGSGRGVKAGPA